MDKHTQQKTVKLSMDWRQVGLSVSPFLPLNQYSELYPVKQWDDALHSLRHFLMLKQPLMLMLGRAGIGKTTLLSKFVMELPEKPSCKSQAVVLDGNSLLQPLSICSRLAKSWSIEFGDQDCSLHKQCQAIVNHFYYHEQSALLIIDNANALSLTALDVIWKLISLQLPKTYCLRIILVGRPNVEPRLKKLWRSPESEPFLKTILSSLSLEESKNFVLHHLKNSGLKRKYYFSDKEITEIYRQSAGVPVEINRIAEALFIRREQKRVLQHKENRKSVNVAVKSGEDNKSGSQDVSVHNSAGDIVFLPRLHNRHTVRIVATCSILIMGVLFWRFQGPMASSADVFLTAHDATSQALSAVQQVLPKPQLLATVSQVGQSVTQSVSKVVKSVPLHFQAELKPKPQVIQKVLPVKLSQFLASASAVSLHGTSQLFPVTMPEDTVFVGQQAQVKVVATSVISQSPVANAPTIHRKARMQQVAVLAQDFGSALSTEIIQKQKSQPVVSEAAVVTAQDVTPINHTPMTVQDITTLKSGYILQVMAVSNPHKLFDFVKSHHLQNTAGLIHTLVKGKDWYLLSYGYYASRVDAAVALRHMPIDLKAFHPWIRKV